MEQICAQCRAELGQQEIKGDWCPACGGALVSRSELSKTSLATGTEIDHRGILLPRRHAVGGVITPQ
jgi:Zn-finger nucleic acid-binding protein